MGPLARRSASSEEESGCSGTSGTHSSLRSPTSAALPSESWSASSGASGAIVTFGRSIGPTDSWSLGCSQQPSGWGSTRDLSGIPSSRGFPSGCVASLRSSGQAARSPVPGGWSGDPAGQRGQKTRGSCNGQEGCRLGLGMLGQGAGTSLGAKARVVSLNRASPGSCRARNVRLLEDDSRVEDALATAEGRSGKGSGLSCRGERSP
jgi:hypothetical protein